MVDYANWLEGAIADSDAQLPASFPNETAADQLMATGVRRKMVTIRRITSLTSVRKSRFQRAIIDGWSVLVPRRQNFKPGQLVVFFEEDSFITHTDRFSNVEIAKEIGNPTRYNNQDGYRVVAWTKTTDSQGRIRSEGYTCHIENVPAVQAAYAADRIEAQANGMDGQQLFDHLRSIDYSDVLGVVKWDESQQNSPNPKALSMIKGTDVTRHQNCANIFDNKYLRAEYQYQETVKKDGASMTVYFVRKDSHLFDLLPNLDETDVNYRRNAVLADGRFGVCSRNYDICKRTFENNTKPYFSTAIRLRLPQILSRHGENIGVQGELVGPNQAGNPYGYAKGSAHDFFVFGVYDLETGVYWNPRRVYQFTQQNGLAHVPIRGYVNIPNVAEDHGALQARANALGEEGLVFRRMADPSRSFKVLNEHWEGGRLWRERGAANECAPGAVAPATADDEDEAGAAGEVEETRAPAG
ncbi:hypothetical protein QBC43DRAFT_217468 [Cladorrhinum sp. PSN259]|nr:hypothetical protein QBC43DRAFT_217468 [Cladorrhinum sp. PSN259]